MTKESPGDLSKDPHPGPSPNLSLNNPDDLWSILRSGFSVIVVNGTVLPATQSSEPEEPAVTALRSSIMAQAQTPEVEIVDEVLRTNYEVLQIVPATSHPIGKLSVLVDLGAPDKDGNQRVRLTLDVSYRMGSKDGEAKAMMMGGGSDEERYENFRAAVRESLAQAFKNLETAPSFPPPF